MVALTPVDALLAVAALPGLQPLDRLASSPVVTALLQVPVMRFGPERPLRVGDPVALAVVAEQGVSLPPDPPAAHAAGWLAQLPGPAGPFQLGCLGVDASTPGQHPGQLPVLADGSGVAFQPALAELLGLSCLVFAVGGSVGLPSGEPLGGLGQGEVLTGLGELAAMEEPPGALAQLGNPPAGGLGLGAGLAHSLLCLLPQPAGVGEQVLVRDVSSTESDITLFISDLG